MNRKMRLFLLCAGTLGVSTLALASFKQLRRPASPSPPAAGATAGRVVAAPQAETPGPEAGPERQRQDAAARRQHETPSPDGRRVVYHRPHDPYRADREPLVFVAEEGGARGTSREIPVRWAARYVSSVEWLDERLVAVRGEAGYLTVLDTAAGEQVLNLRGSNFVISPDRTRVVYSHDFNPRYGYIPPEFETDHVLVSLFGRRAARDTSGEGRAASAGYKVVYPEPLPWGVSGRRPYEDPDERHRLKGGFAWSADSRHVAFVEAHRRRLWLVVLRVEADGDDLVTNARRFELGGADDDVTAVSWEKSGDAVRVSGSRLSWLVRPQESTVQPLP